MPRNARVDVGGEIYHIINRANGRLQIFNKDEEYKLESTFKSSGRPRKNIGK